MSQRRMITSVLFPFFFQAKSVQEKLSEAILKESQCSSEPELSDTSTEEEEESTHKGPQQDNKGIRSLLELIHKLHKDCSLF